jgi:hypothetical protein
VWLYGAVNPETWESMGMIGTSTDTEMFNIYLDMLGRQINPRPSRGRWSIQIAVCSSEKSVRVLRRVVARSRQSG